MNDKKEAPLNPDDYTRIIVLVNGTAVEGVFWCYVAIKPNMLDAFNKAQKEGKLDLKKLKEDGYGEIVVSGLGKNPPGEVTAKVEVMYNVDPKKKFNAQNPAQSVKEAMQELAKKMNENKEE